MKNSSHTQITASLPELGTRELHTITGGAGPNFNAIRQQAQQHCPRTAAKYAGVDPSSVTRAKAVTMGEACLAEMGPFKAAFARGRIESAINSAFPTK